MLPLKILGDNLSLSLQGLVAASQPGLVDVCLQPLVFAII